MPTPYLKNADVARRYNVSTATVSRWFRLARENKNLIQLTDQNGRTVALDSLQNHSEFERLAELGQKYKVNMGKVTTEPRKEFYKVFSIQQQIELIRDIEERKNINFKYMFMGSGAHEYVRLMDVNRVIKKELTSYSNQYFDYLNRHITSNLSELISSPNVQCIDMCVGSGDPIQPILAHLNKAHTISTYHALDVSANMLTINQENIQRYFPNIEYLSTKIDLLVDAIQPRINLISYNNKDYTSIFFNLGDGFNNLSNPETYLGNVSHAMNSGDIFVLTSNANIQKTANYIIDEHSGQRTYRVFADYIHDNRTFDLLGIDTGDFKPVMLLEEYKYTRGFQFNEDHEITIQLPTGPKIISISKNEIVNYLKLETYPLSDLTSWFSKNNLRVRRYISDGECYGIFILTKK